MKEKSQHLQLFHSFANGDDQAFEKLYQLYFPRLYAFSFKIIADSGLAKDVVQNVFIKTWENRALFQIENPEAFIYQMVRNSSLNFIRHLKVVENLKTKVKELYLGEELYYIDMVGNDPYIMIEKELEEKIVEVMDSLPVKCLTVFRLSRTEGLKNSEIASTLGISIKTVEKHISSALQVYKEKFSGYPLLHFLFLVLSNLN